MHMENNMSNQTGQLYTPSRILRMAEL
ncbi:AlpA family transcriptional regulator, partial [Shigella flexneri]|nr:AlpA family transcriptional regulator [Shigella flexneri]